MMSMLKIIQSLQQLDFGRLMLVYAESNSYEASVKYPYLDDCQKLLEVEQDYYAYLREFFRTPESLMAVWCPNGCYTAALRVEQYRDGLLIESLETAPESRRRGYAQKLLQEVLCYLFSKGYCKVYSHIFKDNVASIKLHEACGFRKILDHAVFVDGSVHNQSSTYLIEK